MKRIVLMLGISFFLQGAIDFEGQMFMVIADVFSITLDVRTLAHFFTQQEIDDNNSTSSPQEIDMGDIQVTINDNTTTPDGSNFVYFYSLFSEDQAGDEVVQLVRMSSSASDGGGIQPRLDLVCVDDKNSSGGTANTEIFSGDYIRTRIRQTDATIVNEVHTITLKAAEGTLDENNRGNYQSLIFFNLTST